MSDTMLLGILRMPFDLAMSTPIAQIQYYHRGVQAADEIEMLRAENEMLRADAMRYRWLRAQPKLRLESDEFQSYWIREDGSKFHSSHRLSAKDTRYGIYETLDETIDRAIKVDGKEFI